MKSRKQKSITNLLTATFVAVLVLFPFESFAALIAPRAELKNVLNSRPDLLKKYSASTWARKKTAKKSDPVDLETWARNYGWKEFPEKLSAYKPQNAQINKTSDSPKYSGKSSFPEKSVTAESFIVIDQKTNTVLISRKPDLIWPLASLTKLMTAIIAAETPAKFNSTIALIKSDDVGGGKLHVAAGTAFSFNDLLASMLIGSANNAANAIGRATGGSIGNFVTLMNKKAAELDLIDTTFADPSGIEVNNMGTVKDMAVVAKRAFSNTLVKELTERISWKTQPIDGKDSRLIKNTNQLLTDKKYDDLFVTAGKTGYIDEAKWNLVTMLRPAKGGQHELMVITFGSGSRTDSFDDAATLARWSWKNFSWK